jgi:hypothetical protein
MIALFLAIPNLGDTYLWADEADTAVIARNILTFGLPVMNDGRNVIQYYPTVYDAHYVVVVSPWLFYYIAAASFGLFGISTATARLPFVLIGVIAIAMFPAVVRRMTRDPWIRALAPLVLATSVPFLLYFRQCRYYTPMILGVIWLVWAYLRLIESPEKRPWNALHAVLAAGVVFHTHYLVCLGLFVGLGMHWLAACGTRIPLKTMAGMVCGFAVLTVPWILYAQATILSTFSSRYLGPTDMMSLIERTAHFLSKMSARLGEDFAPPLLLMVFIWLLVDQRYRRWKIVACIGCISLVATTLMVPGFTYVAAVCIGLVAVRLAVDLARKRIPVTPFSLTWMLPTCLIFTLTFIGPSDEVRYLTGIVPFVYVGLLRLFRDLRGLFPRLSTALLLVFLFTNVFRAAPASALSMLPMTAMEFSEILKESGWSRRIGLAQHMPEDRRLYHRTAIMDDAIRVRAPLQSYLYEYLYELTHSYDGPDEGITKYLRQHGTPQDTVKVDSSPIPLIFYTGMVVLPQHLFMSADIEPQWVILRYGNWHGVTEDYMAHIRQRYDRIELPYPDLPFENRPELSLHHFRLPENAYPHVVVYRRRVADTMK